MTYTSLFRKNPLHKFPSLELTHNHNTQALKQVNPCKWWVCHFRGDKFSVFMILDLNNDVLSHFHWTVSNLKTSKTCKKKKNLILLLLFLYGILCKAQIRFVINVPKQVTKPKGYVATLIMLILIIRSWTEKDLF